jgi:hypothetical protein
MDDDNRISYHSYKFARNFNILAQFSIETILCRKIICRFPTRDSLTIRCYFYDLEIAKIPNSRTGLQMLDAVIPKPASLASKPMPSICSNNKC